VEIEVADAQGNTRHGAVVIVIPHNGPHSGCFKTQRLQGCN
jgi:hypothetical protein